MFQNDKFTVVDSSKIIPDIEQHLNFKSKRKKEKVGLSSTKCCGPISITGDEPSVASGTWSHQGLGLIPKLCPWEL